VELDPYTLTPVPDLAQKWAVSADGRTYTFTLRPSRWSDGTPLTADDFVYSLNRVLDPNTGCRFASMLYIIEGAEDRHRGVAHGSPLGVTAVDARTLRITLIGPTPYFLQFLNYNLFRPVPRHLLERLEARRINPALWTRPEHIVVSGAYNLASWRFKRDYVLLKNPTYWGAAKVRLARIWVQMVPSVGTTVNLYRAGALDWTGQSNTLPSAYVAALRKHPDFYQEPVLSSYFYWFNTKRPPLDDVRVRQALTLAVDREALTRYVLRGGQLPNASLVPRGLAGYPAVHRPGLDVAKAQQLLQEAGYGPHNPLPPLTLIYNTVESHRQIAEALQAMWHENLGVQVQLYNQEWQVFLQHITEGDFHLARMGWTGDYPDAYSFLHDVLAQGSGNNMSGWHDPAYEALLKAASLEQDGTRRGQLMHDAENLALEAAPLLPLFTSTQSGLKRPSLKGFVDSVMGEHPYKTLYFDQAETP
jgi:oligopeptide transport system substrate-binding protein